MAQYNDLAFTVRLNQMGVVYMMLGSPLQSHMSVW